MTRILLALAAVLALYAASFALSYAPLGALGLPVALGIAAAKAAIVLTVFMELGRNDATNLAGRVAIGAGVALVLSLVVLVALDSVRR